MCKHTSFLVDIQEITNTYGIQITGKNVIPDLYIQRIMFQLIPFKTHPGVRKVVLYDWLVTIRYTFYTFDNLMILFYHNSGL